jgi:hypothetical protein
VPGVRPLLRKLLEARVFAFEPALALWGAGRLNADTERFLRTLKEELGDYLHSEPVNLSPRLRQGGNVASRVYKMW